MDVAAEVVSVAVLVLLVAVVVRRAVIGDFQTARRSSMTSTSADRRPTSSRLLLLAWAQMATLASAAVCWAASRLAGRREKRAERQWMAALSNARGRRPAAGEGGYDKARSA